MIEEIKKDGELSLEQVMRKKEIIEIAWRMLNIFRNFHVIEGGIEAVNKYFITADDEIIDGIKGLPSGRKLAEHILNLKNGKTKINSISEYLLPFGEDVFLDLPGGKPDIYDKEIIVKVGTPKSQDADVKAAFADYKKTEIPKNIMDKEPSNKTDNNDVEKSESKQIDAPALLPTPDIKEKNSTEKSDVKMDIPEFKIQPEEKFPEPETIEIKDLDAVAEMIKNFTPSPDKLEEFKESKIILNIGSSWEITITEALTNSDKQDKENILEKFRELTMYDKAVSVWNEVQSMLLNQDAINKDDLKHRLPFFKEYLTMFGKSGTKLFNDINIIAEQ